MSNSKKEARSVSILLVEDNPGDILLVRKAFEKARLKNELHVVGTGAAALEFLQREGEYEAASPVDLVLLDLKLPDSNGLDILRSIKSNPKLRRIPVVVLTSSDADQDVINSYDRHANAFLTKPVEFAGLLKIVRELDDFWLSLVKFAPHPDS